MKRLLFILVLVFFFLPKPVFANEGWVIDWFHSDIQIQSSGEVRISETIDVDFFDLQKHGIFRDLPVVYERDTIKTYTEVKIETVLRNGSSEKYELLKNESYIRLKIGNPDSTISGKNNYTILYSVKGVLREFDDYDELYWNITGNTWPVPIQNASAQTILPFDGRTQVTCFEGVSGSTAPCKSEKINERQASFNTSRSLGSYEGMTVVVGYQKGIIPLLTIERPKSFFEKLVEPLSLTTLLTILAFGTGTVLFIWYKYGRDYWFGGIPFILRRQQESIKPIGAKESVVVEYEPPEKLKPAEMGVLIDETAHTHDVVATIIDLAARGFLTITEEPKKWIFGKADYILSKTEKETKELEIYELYLLNCLFKEGDIVSLSSLKTKFYDELKEVKDHLYTQVVHKKLFPTNPDKVRLWYLGIGIGISVIAGVLIATSSQFNLVYVDVVYIIDIFIGILVSGLVLMLCSFFMPRRTAYGRELYRRTRGYREFIENVEKYRQKFFEKENMFNVVLPYAIVFGLTDKFTKAMRDLGVQNIQPAWYVGTQPLDANAFASSITSFSNSVSSSIAATPKGSGFSGGSSGGGFGGGGGGSW